jgi:hypothetical protein
VQVACLYDKQGAVFAQLSKVNEKITCPLSIGDEKTRFESVNLFGCGSFGPNKTAMRSKGKFLKDLSKRPPSGM